MAAVFVVAVVVVVIFKGFWGYKRSSTWCHFSFGHFLSQYRTSLFLRVAFMWSMPSTSLCKGPIISTLLFSTWLLGWHSLATAIVDLKEKAVQTLFILLITDFILFHTLKVISNLHTWIALLSTSWMTQDLGKPSVGGLSVSSHCAHTTVFYLWAIMRKRNRPCWEEMVWMILPSYWVPKDRWQMESQEDNILRSGGLNEQWPT